MGNFDNIFPVKRSTQISFGIGFVIAFLVGFICDAFVDVFMSGMSFYPCGSDRFVSFSTDRFVEVLPKVAISYKLPVPVESLSFPPVNWIYFIRRPATFNLKQFFSNKLPSQSLHKPHIGLCARIPASARSGIWYQILYQSLYQI